jgi:anti-sigma28 factor (negative regulator of flagellin synthesis)
MRTSFLTGSQRATVGTNARTTAATPIRHELVARVRQEIAAGTYDTSAKFDAALLRLFERLS